MRFLRARTVRARLTSRNCVVLRKKPEPAKSPSGHSWVSPRLRLEVRPWRGLTEESSGFAKPLKSWTYRFHNSEPGLTRQVHSSILKQALMFLRAGFTASGLRFDPKASRSRSQ